MRRSVSGEYSASPKNWLSRSHFEQKPSLRGSRISYTLHCSLQVLVQIVCLDSQRGVQVEVP